MAYRYADRTDRWKAITAVLAVHAVLGTLILSGLNVEIASRVADRLETFSIRIPEPPPEEPPPPETRREDSAPEEAGAPGKKAEPTPVVAPKPKIVLPPREVIAAATRPGTGSASSSGAANSGSGPGAGGSGSGRGGGGFGGGGNSPAQLVRNLSRGDYRALAAGRLPTGRAMVSLRVEPSGMASNCRVVRSSGDAVVDRGLCPLVTRTLRFRPARDASGRPIPYDLQYVATWRI